jgi:hypothetical protein
MLRMGAIGAGIGIGVDALIRGRKTVYETTTGSPRLTATPFAGPGVQGFQLSLSF